MGLVDWILSLTGGNVSATVTLGTGYKTPQPPDTETSADIKDLHPELLRRYLALKAEFEAETKTQLFPTRTWSNPAHQFALFQKGRKLKGMGLDMSDPDNWEPLDPVNHAGIVTFRDGYKKKSRHNVYPSEAVDSAVDSDPGPGKHVTWDDVAYGPLGPLALKHGLVWGGTWKRPHDTPHLELPGDAA